MYLLFVLIHCQLLYCQLQIDVLFRRKTYASVVQVLHESWAFYLCLCVQAGRVQNSVDYQHPTVLGDIKGESLTLFCTAFTEYFTAYEI